MQIGQKYGNGFGSSPSVPVLIEIPNFMIEIWKIVRHHVLAPRPDSGHPTVEWGDLFILQYFVPYRGRCPKKRVIPIFYRNFKISRFS